MLVVWARERARETSCGLVFKLFSVWVQTSSRQLMQTKEPQFLELNETSYVPWTASWRCARMRLKSSSLASVGHM